MRPERCHSRLLLGTAVLLAAAGHGTASSPSPATAVNARPAFDDWSQAGYPGEIPDVSTPILDARVLGAVPDDGLDDAGAIQAAIDSAPDPAVVLLPTGTYRIESEIVMSSGVVLRGEGYRHSHVECLNAGGCFRVEGSRTGGFVDVTGGMAKGSSQITLADASGFSVGEGAEIQQDDIVTPWATWGEYSVGQMLRIVAIDGNTLSIEPGLHIDLDPAKSPQIRPVSYVERVGFEDLHLLRISSGESNDSSNLNLVRAADCWVRRIDSDSTEKYHVAISESLHLDIRDSYIHDAESKGDGGEGYGVSLARHVTSVLVENNIFNELRHAMIIQLGTNGCVFGYNYARRNYSDDGWDKSYISLHGHYPFLNLFEGNYVGLPYLGDYWGEIGPDNTLLRNRVVGTDKHRDFGPYRGIALRYFHGPQYLIGNEVTGNDGIYYAGDATGDPDDVVLHGNNVIGEGISWDPRFPQELPDSYYLDARPAFYGGMSWPSLGGDLPLGEGTIPALERWQTGSYIPETRVFADGFESGDTTAWTLAVPG